MDINDSLIEEFATYSLEQFRSIESFKKEREILSDRSFLRQKHAAVIGEKGIGKTVLIKQFAKHHFADKDLREKAIYISIDHTPFAGYSMFEIAKSLKRRGYELVIFDEVHKREDWQTDIKTIIDSLDIKLIISGSSIIDLKKNLGGLARRMISHELRGFSFREYLNFAHSFSFQKISLPELLQDHQSISEKILGVLANHGANFNIYSLFKQYLISGYYIFSFGCNDVQSFLQLMRQAVEDTIEGDVAFSREKIDRESIRKIKNLFSIISKNVPFAVNLTKLKDATAIKDDRTLKFYLDALEIAGIIRVLVGKNLRELRKMEKIYLGNTNLYHAFSPSRSPDIGSVREIFFLNAMDLGGHEVFHHPRRADFFCDGITFEIGGRRKTTKQIVGEDEAFLVVDDIDFSLSKRKIPIWLFGFLS